MLEACKASSELRVETKEWVKPSYCVSCRFMFLPVSEGRRVVPEYEWLYSTVRSVEVLTKSLRLFDRLDHRADNLHSQMRPGRVPMYARNPQGR